MCPHRLAPLSEGRIDEQGCLQCCYHGWSFNGDGSCARIPQAQPEGPEAKAAGEYEKNHHLLKWYSARIVSCTKWENLWHNSLCIQGNLDLQNVGCFFPGNKMAHCISFPTVVKQGILFIWPDEYGQELADKTLPPITPGISTYQILLSCIISSWFRKTIFCRAKLELNLKCMPVICTRFELTLLFELHLMSFFIMSMLGCRYWWTWLVCCGNIPRCGLWIWHGDGKSSRSKPHPSCSSQCEWWHSGKAWQCSSNCIGIEIHECQRFCGWVEKAMGRHLWTYLWSTFTLHLHVPIQGYQRSFRMYNYICYTHV